MEINQLFLDQIYQEIQKTLKLSFQMQKNKILDQDVVENLQLPMNLNKKIKDGVDYCKLIRN